MRNLRNSTHNKNVVSWASPLCTMSYQVHLLSFEVVMTQSSLSKWRCKIESCSYLKIIGQVGDASTLNLETFPKKKHLWHLTAFGPWSIRTVLTSNSIWRHPGVPKTDHSRSSLSFMGCESVQMKETSQIVCNISQYNTVHYLLYAVFIWQCLTKCLILQIQDGCFSSFRWTGLGHGSPHLQSHGSGHGNALGHGVDRWPMAKENRRGQVGLGLGRHGFSRRVSMEFVSLMVERCANQM